LVSLGFILGCSTNLAAPLQPDTAHMKSPLPQVTLALLGDVMLGREVKTSSDTFSYLQPFLQSADLALANLESPLSTAPAQTTSAYSLCADTEQAAWLAKAGLDLLSLANNHHLDCGLNGLAETQQVLREAGLEYIGPGAAMVLRQVKGVSLAFLAFNATNDFDLEAAAKNVRSAHDSGASVIVSMHWGNEYQSGSSPEQERIANRLAESGATVIWGHHAHVLQPMTWINETLVLYGLGNALFDQGGLASTRQSALVFVTLDTARAREVRAIPFVIDVPGSRILPPDTTTAAAIQRFFK